MRVTNAEVWLAHEALPKLCQMGWPVKVAYRMAKLARKVGDIRRDIDKVRIDLITRHGKAGEHGQISVTPDCEGFTAFAAGWNELMAEETEISGVEMIVLPTDLGTQVATETLMNLMVFVTIEDEDDA